MQDIKAITEALAAPFEPSEVKWKPAVVSGSRALAMAYVDARVVQDRLDDVLGVENWQDNYRVLDDGSVVCRLSLKIGGVWITKMDVGSMSEQGDAGDRRKAAFSDSLKRTAVKFGVGRYLYRLPSQWVQYDPQKKQIVSPPQLPPWALPAGKTSEKPVHPRTKKEHAEHINRQAKEGEKHEPAADEWLTAAEQLREVHRRLHARKQSWGDLFSAYSKEPYWAKKAAEVRAYMNSRNYEAQYPVSVCQVEEIARVLGTEACEWLYKNVQVPEAAKTA